MKRILFSNRSHDNSQRGWTSGQGHCKFLFRGTFSYRTCLNENKNLSEDINAIIYIYCKPSTLTSSDHELPHQKKHEKIGKNGGWFVRGCVAINCDAQKHVFLSPIVKGALNVQEVYFAFHEAPEGFFSPLSLCAR